MAVTAVALMYQWAEIATMALGCGAAVPKAAHARVYRLSSRAFIGVPCPKNAAGIVALSVICLRPDVFLSDCTIAPPGNRHHPTSAFELADDTCPLPGSKGDRVGRDPGRRPPR